MTSIEKATEHLRKKPSATDEKKQGMGKNNAEPAGLSHENLGKIRPRYHLDLDHLGELGFITPSSERTQSAKEYQVLKRPLLMNALGKGARQVEHGNLIVVTSPLPGEGKSQISLNLAMSIAMEKDMTILLVDSDVIKPSLTHLLGLEKEPGLTDVLLDTKMDIGSVIIRTDFPKLSILPAGRAHLQSTELLASEQMSQLVSELSERYLNRIVLFDSPPQLATSEASVLAQLAGQVLMVVEEAKTPQKAVKEAIAQIDSNKIIGMVLNKCQRSFGTRSYGYGYGKGYGYK